MRTLLLVSLAASTACGSQAQSTSDESSPSGHEDGFEVTSSKLEQSCSCSMPTSGLYATFSVGSETYRQQITSPSAMTDAIALWQGRSSKTVPVGQLRCSCVGWNCDYGWFVSPESIRFTQFAIELCDGLPSHVQQNCPGFGGGSFCPWSAKLVDLRDCRASRTCPPVPR
jgi:hypothetical protein